MNPSPLSLSWRRYSAEDLITVVLREWEVIGRVMGLVRVLGVLSIGRRERVRNAIVRLLITKDDWKLEKFKLRKYETA